MEEIEARPLKNLWLIVFRNYEWQLICWFFHFLTQLQEFIIKLFREYIIFRKQKALHRLGY